MVDIIQKINPRTGMFDMTVDPNSIIIPDGIPAARDASFGSFPFTTAGIPDRWVISVPGTLPPPIGDVNVQDFIVRDGANRALIPAIQQLLMTDIIYADLMTAVGNATLIPGMKYRITDFQTIHLMPGTTDVNTGPIEPIITTALDIDVISSECYSDTNPDDIIYRDYKRDNIQPADITELVSANGSTIGDILMTITGSNKLEIEVDLSLCSTRTIQLNDCNGYFISYTQASLPGDYTLTDLGGGVREFTAGISWLGNLQELNPKPSSAYISVTPASISRPGRIFRRINTTQNIDIPCDFREVKQYRYFLDLTKFDTFNIGNTYMAGQISYVPGNDIVYISLSHNNTGNNPGGSPGSRAISLISASVVPYMISDMQMGASGSNYYGNYTTGVSAYMFSDIIGNFSLTGIRDFKIESLSINYNEEIPNFFSGNSTIINTYFKDAHNITIFSSAINNVIAGQALDGNILVGGIDSCDLGIGFTQNIAMQLSGVTFSYNTYSNNINSVYSCMMAPSFFSNICESLNSTSFGAMVGGNALMSMTSCVIDGEMQGNIMLGLFTYSHFAPGFRQNRVTYGKQIKHCDFGLGFGIGGFNTLNGDMDKCIFGANAYNNTFNENLYDLTIGVDCRGNTWMPGGTFQYTKVGCSFRLNTISALYSRGSIGDNVFSNTFNTITQNCHLGNNIANNNFSTATLLDTPYEKDIRYGIDFSTLWMTYLDGSGNTVVVDALT